MFHKFLPLNQFTLVVIIIISKKRQGVKGVDRDF